MNWTWGAGIIFVYFFGALELVHDFGDIFLCRWR